MERGTESQFKRFNIMYYSTALNRRVRDFSEGGYKINNSEKIPNYYLRQIAEYQ